MHQRSEYNSYRYGIDHCRQIKYRTQIIGGFQLSVQQHRKKHTYGYLSHCGYNGEKKRILKGNAHIGIL